MKKRSLFLVMVFLGPINFLKAPEGGFGDWVRTTFGLKPKEGPRQKPTEDPTLRREPVVRPGDISSTGSRGTTGGSGKPTTSKPTTGKAGKTTGSGSTGTRVVSQDPGMGDMTVRDESAVRNAGKGPQFSRPARNVVDLRLEQGREKAKIMIIDRFRDQLEENELDTQDLTWFDKYPGGSAAKKQINQMIEEFEEKVVRTQGKVDMQALQQEMDSLIFEMRKIKTAVLRQKNAQTSAAMRAKYQAQQ